MIIARYPDSRSALLPLLHLVQAEDGYLTPAGIAFCAAQLDLTAAEVTAVATFYSMYRRTPTGDYLVGVCTNTLCAVMGGDAILEALQDHLGVHAGQTTADGQDHPRARRVQRRLRLRAGRDGELGVLRQPDAVVGARPRRRAARRRSADTVAQRARCARSVKPPERLPDFPIRRAPTTRRPWALPRWPACDIARERGMSAPDVEGPATDSTGDAPGHEQAEAAEAVKDQPAPAPSADVPVRGQTAETDPDATDTP